MPRSRSSPTASRAPSPRPRRSPDKAVGVSAADIVQQCLNAGLLDEIVVNLVPVLLGAGIRLFDDLAGTVELEGPRVVEGTGVTHLSYRVRSV